MHDIAIANSGDLVAMFTEATEDLEDLVRHSKAPRTLASYESDFRQFSRWARSRGMDIPEVFDGAEIPPAAVMLYLSDSQGLRKPSTMQRHLAALRHFHHSAGLASPTDHPKVREVLAGFSRKHHCEPDRAEPLFLADLRAGLPRGDDARSIRDRAMLLVGWWGALRRSELAALTVADVKDHPEGLVVTIRRSKTDQEGAGAKLALHYRTDPELCPVRALRAHLAASGVELGRIFAVSTQTINRVVKVAAERAGFDPRDYSAHSLRAGHVSECDRRGVPNSAVRATTRHLSDQMLSTYSRPGELFSGSSGAYFEV